MRRADNPTAFMCRMSRNLGAPTSRNPQGLSRDWFTFNLLNGGGWPTSRPDRFTPGNNPVSTTGDWRKSYNEELGYLSLSTKYCSAGQIKEGERVGSYGGKKNECSGLVGGGERKRPCGMK